MSGSCDNRALKGLISPVKHGDGTMKILYTKNIAHIADKIGLGVMALTAFLLFSEAFAQPTMLMTRETWQNRRERAEAAGYNPAMVLRKSAAEEYALDFAWHDEGHPTPAALKAANVVAVVRYVSYSTSSKDITRREFESLIDGGIGVALVWEWAADDCMGGGSQGTADANVAVEEARAIGYPPRCVIYGACDFDVSRSQWTSACGDYYRNFAVVLRNAGYRPGIYGPWDAIEWAWADGSVDFGWQASASWAWSYQRNRDLHERTNLSQEILEITVDGQDVDRNDIITPFFGQYLPGKWPPPDTTQVKGPFKGEPFAISGRYRERGGGGHLHPLRARSHDPEHGPLVPRGVRRAGPYRPHPGGEHRRLAELCPGPRGQRGAGGGRAGDARVFRLQRHQPGLY
jgi:hypothetical protein